MINKAHVDGLLAHPLGDSFGGDYPIVQYVDDTLIVMPTEIDQMLHLQSLLQTFTQSKGLKVNFSKSSLTPIIVDGAKVVELAASVGSIVGSTLFTYLVLPLGKTRPTVKEYMPMMNQIERNNGY